MTISSTNYCVVCTPTCIVCDRGRYDDDDLNVRTAKCKDVIKREFRVFFFLIANRYKKGGKGSLVKCYKERIVEDFTEGQLQCPGCGQEFARDTMVHGKPAFKMIGGKVYQKK